MWEAFAVLLIFSTKNICVFGYKVRKHLTSWPLNELIKLTMLWTTGPRSFYAICKHDFRWATWSAESSCFKIGFFFFFFFWSCFCFLFVWFFLLSYYIFIARISLDFRDWAFLSGYALVGKSLSLVQPDKHTSALGWHWIKYWYEVVMFALHCWGKCCFLLNECF